MSTALVTTLRESCGYLRDAGYRQTAQLMVAAADEIERLTRRVQALEAGGEPPTARREVHPRATADTSPRESRQGARLRRSK